MGVPDLRFIMSLYVNKRREREGRLVTLAPSMHVYIKQQPLSPPSSLPPKPFTGNRSAIFYVLSPAGFSEGLTTSGLLKMLQISLEGLNTRAS